MPASKRVAAPAPEPEPIEDQPGHIGAIVGIPAEPETFEQHQERLGEAAGTPGDLGWLLGTIKPSNAA